MLKDFLNFLSGKEDPLATVTYDCDPLLIVDEAGQIYFSGRINVDFTPSVEDGSRGIAVADADSTGWQPKLNVQQRFDNRTNPDPDIRARGGLIWVGVDDEGTPFTWYVGRAADTFVLNRKEGIEEAEEDA